MEIAMAILTVGRRGRCIEESRYKWFIALPTFAVVVAFSSTISTAGELHDAVLSNDSAALETLLDGGSMVDESDFMLGTALHHAAVDDNVESAKLLIAHGADVEAVSEQQGSRPLHLAVDANSIKVLRLLIQVGADIESTDDLGQRPLYRAATRHPEAVEILLDSGAEIDAREEVYHRTPLIVAAYKGCLGCARYLVRRGADINARDDLGKTALWYAATPSSYLPVGGPQLIEFLAKNGADLEVRDKAGMTPLAWARNNGIGMDETFKEIAEILIDLGAKN
jgi:ankyrin repeat protein